MKRPLLIAVPIAISSLLFGSSGNAIAGQQTTADSFCSFKHKQTFLRDTCQIKYSTEKIAGMYKNITLRWSDGVTTNIEIKSSMSTGGTGGVYNRGIAKVDNADAIFTDGEDMMCFEIPENSKTICYQ